MPKKIIFAKIAGLLFLLASTWSIFFIARTILEAPNNLNGNHIPKNATFVAKIDGKAFLKSGVSDVFVGSRDNEVIHLFEALSDRRSKKKSTKKSKKSRNIGVDYVSDIYFFTLTEGENRILGISTNLSNQKRFEKYVPAFLDEHQGFASTPEVGIILHSIIADSSSFPSQKKLNAMARQFLEKPGAFDLELLDDDNSRTIAKSWSKDGKGTINDFFSSSNLSFELNPHQLFFNGTVQTPENEVILTKDIAPSGLHLFSGNLPTFLADTLSSFYEDSAHQLSPITGISLNYRGLSIVENDGFLPVPKIDVLIRFEEKTTISEVLSLNILSENIMDVKNNSFRYQESTFNVQQVDAYSIYIGESDFKATPTPDNQLFKASGSIHELTTIEASGMVSAFIKLFPLYSASDDFTHSVKNIDISVLSSDKGKPQQMTGSIDFKKGHFALNSLIKLMLKGEIIK